jgi:hypothetical protein
MSPNGILVIRSDIAPEIEADYLAWLTREHTLERVGVAGFVSARIFRCCRCDVRRYMILYDLDSPSVVDSDAYLARLNNPTPWSARMMPHLGAFMRGGGAVVATAGAGNGSALLPLVLDDDALGDGPAVVNELAGRDGIVAVRLVEADAERTTAPSRERTLRSADASFERLLLIESLSPESAVAAAATNAALMRSIDGADRSGSAYREIFHLGKGTLPH